MRKFAIAALAATVPLMLAAPSFAAPRATYKLRVAPNKAKRSVTLKVLLTYKDSAGAAVTVNPLQFTDITLPPGFKLDTKFQGKRSNQCDSRKVQQQTKNPTADCPKASLLGVGGAGFIASAGTTKIPANTVKITRRGAPSSNRGVLIYNARVRTDVNKSADDSNGIAPQCKRKPTFFIYTNALKPVQDQRVFPGCFVTVGGKSVIRVPIYKIVVAGLLVSVVKFDSTFKGYKTGTCPRGGWKSSATTTYRTATGNPGRFKYTARSAAVRCRR